MRSDRLREYIFYSVLVVASLWWRFDAAGRTRPALYPDSSSYLALAKAPLFTFESLRPYSPEPVGLNSDPSPESTLVGIKPFTVPLLYKLGAADVGIISRGQVVLGAFAWVLLAFVVARTLRQKYARAIAFISILAFSLTSPVMQWDHVIASESISMSLLALLVAASTLLLARWSRWVAGVWALLVILWASARDTNAYAVLTLAIGLLLVAAAAQVKRYRAMRRVAVGEAHYAGAGAAQTHAIRRMFLLSGLCFTIFLGSYFLYRASKRDVFTTFNIVGMRVLPSSEVTAFFVERGMPYNVALADRSGRAGSDDNWAFYSRADLTDFRAWAHAKGQSTYVAYLLAHPATLLAGLSDTLHALVFPVAVNEAPEEFFTFEQDVLTFYAYPAGALWLVVIVATAVLFILTSFAGRSSPVPSMLGWGGPYAGLAAVCATLVVSGLFTWVVAWVGDALEVDRHILQPSVHLHLAAWVLLAIALDAYLTQIRARALSATTLSTT